MLDDWLFRAAHVAIAPAWLAMLLAPRARVTEWLARSLAVPLLVGLLYTGLALVALPTARGGFGSLDEVAALFDSRRVVLVGWIHYLCFDLVVASLLYRDARRIGLHHALLVPCLLLTLLLGPAGLLLYRTVRLSRARGALVID